jgi:outer membrane protein insertion porin family
MGMITSTDGSILPYIHRYRAGGMQSIRGYGWYTLGPSLRAAGYRSSSQSAFSGSDDPKAADDQLVVGGTQTWINNVEVEIPIVPAAGIRAVVFFDAGNAFGDPWGNGTINLADMRMAYGTGIRWMSPMGPLRFEWGFPINPYPDERKMVFDFAMGSLF